MTNEEKGGSKYAYLLQPIKDLERNFAINIVELLEEYTKTLDAVAAAEDFQIDNAHRFNFAEAAMLIHGSANVFGKKVDLIHNQALNFFEVLKISKEKKKKNKGDDDDEDEGIGGDDQMDPFVPVDPCILQNFSKLKPAQLPSLVSKNPQLPIPSISIMPMSLMPLADFEKCNVPIYNSKNKNEVVGKKDDYKINTGYMSRTGALLLDLLNERLTNLFVKESRINTTEIDRDSGCNSPMNGPDTEVDLPPFSQEYDPGRPSNAIEMIRRAAGPSLDANTLIHRPSSVHLMHDGKTSQPLAVLPEEFSNSFGGNFDIDDIPETPVKKKEPWEKDDDEEVDPVIDKIEDPFQEVNWKQKPYKVGKNTINVPALLERKKREYERKDPKEKVMEFIDYVNDQIMYLGKKQKLKRELGLGTQHKWEVDAILPYIAAQQKRRIKARREIVVKRKAQEKEENRKRDKLPPPAAEYDEDDDFAADAYDDPANDENLPINRLVNSSTIQRPLMADVEDDDLAGDLNFPAVYVDAASQNPELVVNIDTNTNGIHDGMSVEQIIAFYRMKYWEQTAEAMSKLAARVQEWDEKMQPILEEEETRKEFDIHEYGDELIGFFDEIKQEKEFPKLLRGKKGYEISRYFLSTLMMANTMNLEIINEQQSGPDPLKMMRVKLLKRERHHEVFDQNGAM